MYMFSLCTKHKKPCVCLQFSSQLEYFDLHTFCRWYIQVHKLDIRQWRYIQVYKLYILPVCSVQCDVIIMVYIIYIYIYIYTHTIYILGVKNFL